MKIPYTEMQLLAGKLELMDIIERDEGGFEEKSEEVRREFEAQFPEAKKDLNARVAEFHGITVDTLVNSPNYTTLTSEYGEDVLKRLIGRMKEKLGLTDLQAWTLFAIGKGII